MIHSARRQPHMIYLSEIIVPIARKLGHESDTEQVLKWVEALLYTIGRTLPFSKAVRFFTALPTPLQALMVDQWEVDQFLPPAINSLPDLVDEITSANPALFGNVESREALAKDVFFATMVVIAHHVTPDAMEQVISIFPEDAQERIHAAIIS